MLLNTHLFLNLMDSLHTFGRNMFGQLGDGTTIDRNTPTQILSSGVAQVAVGELLTHLFLSRMALFTLLEKIIRTIG